MQGPDDSPRRIPGGRLEWRGARVDGAQGEKNYANKNGGDSTR
jgi:hypothetical protein